MRDLIHGESQISYKCTDFCDDEVLFSGTAHGGRTELSSDKAPSALMAVTVAEELGIFGIKPSKAMDMLTGKRVSLGLSIDAYDRVVRGPVGAFLFMLSWWRLCRLLLLCCVDCKELAFLRSF